MSSIASRRRSRSWSKDTTESRLAPAYAFLEHTGEVRLSARAGDLAGVLAEAGRGLAELELGGRPPCPSGDWKAIDVRSTDRVALVVDWLNELIYRAEVDRWVPVEFDVWRVTDTHVRARARGVPVEQAPALVKAATLHGARVEAIPGGVEANVVLDV